MRLRHLVLAALLPACLLAPAARAEVTLQYLGQQIVPSGAQAFGTRVGGLSGLDYDSGTSRYWAISDDRSQVNPARFYNLSLDLAKFSRAPAPGFAGVKFNSVTTLLRPDGTAFPLNQVDAEAIRIRGGNLLWTSEGQRLPGDLQNPLVREMRTDGQFIRELPTPARYNPAEVPTPRGVANSFGFESLAFDASGKRLYTAVENALVQDGPLATAAAGSPARVLALDPVSGSALAEYVYVTERVTLAPTPPDALALTGLVEILALTDREFLALEKTFAVGAGHAIKLFRFSLDGATDVLGLGSLAGASYQPVAKTLLLDFATLTNDDGSPVTIDNLEGMTFGPEREGRRTLVLVSDDNFSSRQATQFLAFEVIEPVPEPSSYALLLAGAALLVLAAAVLRRRAARG
jgi:hypothetical protein